MYFEKLNRLMREESYYYNKISEVVEVLPSEQARCLTRWAVIICHKELGTLNLEDDKPTTISIEELDTRDASIKD